jgi:hypothetical protein
MDNQNAPRELNITAHRSRASVWRRRGWDGTPEPLALSRLLVALGGGALAVEGLRQRSAAGMTLVGLGGALTWWALTGERDLSDAQRWLRRVVEQLPWRAGDRIHEASADSFPASDAPSWTPTTGAGQHGVAH